MFFLNYRFNEIFKKINNMGVYITGASAAERNAKNAVTKLNAYCSNRFKTAQSFFWGDGLQLRINAWSAVNTYADVLINTKQFVKKRNEIPNDSHATSHKNERVAQAGEAGPAYKSRGFFNSKPGKVDKNEPSLAASEAPCKFRR